MTNDIGILKWLRNSGLIKKPVWSGSNCEYLAFDNPVDATAFILRFPGKYVATETPPA